MSGDNPAGAELFSHRVTVEGFLKKMFEFIMKRNEREFIPYIDQNIDVGIGLLSVPKIK